PHGFTIRLVDMGDHQAVEQELAFGPAILWTESPSNPLQRTFDLKGLAKLAASANSWLVVDNTSATIALQRPLDWGATACVYSLSKATSGHSDVIMGLLSTRDAQLLERAKLWRSFTGNIPGPFEAWLVLRGAKTLALRMEQQSKTALEVARWLAGHPAVARVNYPGLDPGLHLERQMPKGWGSLLSFKIVGEVKTADAIVSSAQLITPGTSFGGIESTWERFERWSNEVNAPPNLIRLSVGLEPASELIEDIRQAFQKGGLM
ncbi:MAG: trans-sulfuration enzyme family protein, partial [Candidatus Dormibacteraceae bacterium]